MNMASQLQHCQQIQKLQQGVKTELQISYLIALSFESHVTEIISQSRNAILRQKPIIRKKIHYFFPVAYSMPMFYPSNLL